MYEFDISDFEWRFIEPVLPQKSRGVPRSADRRVLNGIFYALRTGCPWRDIPGRYRPYTTIYNRFNRWTKAGIWDGIMMDAAVDADNDDVVMIDGTSVRVHHSAVTLKKPPGSMYEPFTRWTEHQVSCSGQ